MFNVGEVFGFVNCLVVCVDELIYKIQKVEFGGNIKWVGNMKCYCVLIEGLVQVVIGNWFDYGVYLNWLGFGCIEVQVIVDMMLFYVLLSEDEFCQMIVVWQDVKVIYLVCDLFVCFWSYVCMVVNCQGCDV